MCYSILVQQNLKILEREFGAMPVRTQFDHYEHLTSVDPKRFKAMTSHSRIYPNYFAPIIAKKNDKSWVIPMRYRVRPMGSTEEIPTKYNVFNARLDSLTSRDTWSRLIGHNHGLLVIKEFYEWVADDSSEQEIKPHQKTSKKKIIGIRPEGHDYMLTPVLWDWWESKDKTTSFFSFAVITGEPPADVLRAGHDRCPIFLSKEDAALWLEPHKGGHRLEVGAIVEESLKILSHTVQSSYIIRTAM